ncbi:hypothetical protein Tcan_03048 [Toxocara canis]|uniref:Uncharacterized protein n=1 Tax=Toxocara canis TaxID=6265 RepID=A0A0B2VJ08_TOXCA|nr:hypothetical protein Tcan_03048 [Toxocara canis]
MIALTTVVSRCALISIYESLFTFMIILLTIFLCGKKRKVRVAESVIEQSSSRSLSVQQEKPKKTFIDRLMMRKPGKNDGTKKAVGGKETRSTTEITRPTTDGTGTTQATEQTTDKTGEKIVSVF